LNAFKASYELKKLKIRRI